MSALVRIRSHSSAFISIHPVGALLRSDIQPFDCSADGGLLFTVLRPLSSGCGATIHCSAATIQRLWCYYPLFCGHYPAVVVLLSCSAATIQRLWRYYPLFYGYYPAAVVLLYTILRSLSSGCGVTILFCGRGVLSFITISIHLPLIIQFFSFRSA